MIILNISTSKDDISEEDIVSTFIENNIECQIIKTFSTISSSNLSYQVERGFKISIFSDIEGNAFKEKIWKTIQKKMDLKCAFIKYKEEYMGCILNWPGVFCKSNCEECK